MSMLADLLPLRAKNRVRAAKAQRLELPPVDWAKLGSLALGSAALAALAGIVVFALNRPVRHVDVAGIFQRVSPLDVEQCVRTRLRGGFITANLDDVRRVIETIPWVDHARVQRRWPDALVVQVTEQRAVARWGESGLLNSRGEVFIKDTAHVPPELPRLDGPPGSERQVATLFFQVQPRLLEAGMAMSALRLDARGAWELDLASGVTVRFGRRQLDERIERFFKVGAPVVAGRPNDIAFLDMRYSNGFAVGWRTQGGQRATPAPAGEGPDTQKRDQDA
jgi:cell division protein FtsQ